jgi:hypothetical protein
MSGRGTAQPLEMDRPMTDRTTDASQRLECKDCGDMFELTAAERQFFTSRGLSLPKRCKPCRAYKRQERAEGQGPR